jgi:hypothetical protein
LNPQDEQLLLRTVRSWDISFSSPMPYPSC